MPSSTEQSDSGTVYSEFSSENSVLVSNFQFRFKNGLTAIYADEHLTLLREDKSEKYYAVDPETVLYIIGQALQPLQIETVSRTAPAGEPLDTKEAKDKPKQQDESSPYVIENFVEVESRRPSDCPVVAIANILQMDYSKARVEAFHHGWSSAKGATLPEAALVLEKFGCKLMPRPQYKGMLAANFKSDRIHLIVVANHIMAYIDGRLINPQTSALRPIQEIYEIQTCS